MISSILGWLGNFFSNLFSVVLGFFADLFAALFNGLVALLKLIFKPILILVAIIFYFLYQLAVLVWLLIQVLLGIGKMIYQFVMGLLKTLTGLTWTAATPDHGSWSGAIGNVFQALQPYQLDKVAYVILFAIWIFTAYTAIKLLTGRGEQ